MSRTLVERLGELGKKIQEADRSKNILEGRLTENRKRLKDEYGVETAAEAEKLLDQMDREIANNETVLAEKIAELENKVGQIEGVG